MILRWKQSWIISLQVCNDRKRRELCRIIKAECSTVSACKKRHAWTKPAPQLLEIRKEVWRGKTCGAFALHRDWSCNDIKQSTFEIICLLSRLSCKRMGFLVWLVLLCSNMTARLYLILFRVIPSVINFCFALCLPIFVSAWIFEYHECSATLTIIEFS